MDIIKTKDELRDFLEKYHPGEESYWTFMVFMREKPYEIGDISGIAIEYTIREVHLIRDEESYALWCEEPEFPVVCNESLKTPTETFDLEKNYDYKGLLRDQIGCMLEAINKPLVDENALNEDENRGEK
jgi:hypothetical protein